MGNALLFTFAPLLNKHRLADTALKKHGEGVTRVSVASKREGTAESWRRWLTPCAAPSRPCFGQARCMRESIITINFLLRCGAQRDPASTLRRFSARQIFSKILMHSGAYYHTIFWSIFPLGSQCHNSTFLWCDKRLL